MSDEQESIIERMGDPNLVKKITTKILMQYIHDIEARSGDIVCPVCHSTEWLVPTSKSDTEHPNVVTMPLPLQPGIGMWAFPVTCITCYNMLFFETSLVAKELAKNGKI